MRVQDKEKCIVEERGGGGGNYLKKNVWWGGGRGGGRRRGGGGPPPFIKRGTLMVEWGYSEEEGEVEEEEEGQRGKMFKEEKQNWIKKNVLWRREEVEEGNI